MPTWKSILIAATLASGATAIAAQEQKPTTPQAPMMGRGQEMMPGMPMMGMMQQMSQMMETCNKMMQSAMAQPRPEAPPAQPQPKQ
jgi:protein CpxP